MKWLDSLIRNTSCYKRLYRELGLSKKEHEHLDYLYKKQYERLLECLNDRKNLEQIVKTNKTNARKIHKLTTDKNIRKLCNKIIKGEK